ncbi:MAG: AIR carboxylase family protein [Anaerolineae bacterium]|nr:AIR carboxylase family protein [Anaerolineae bacterium]
MGSRSDLKHAQTIVAALEKFGIESQIRVASAHKTPAVLLDILTQYEADPRPKVYITIAGRSNALSGMVDAQVTAPVIACPPLSDAFGGADIFSSLRMPSGVAPAVILDAEGAALVAAKIFGLADAAIREKIAALQADNRDRLARDDAELNP